MSSYFFLLTKGFVFCGQLFNFVTRQASADRTCACKARSFINLNLKQQFLSETECFYNTDKCSCSEFKPESIQMVILVLD